MLFFLIAGNIIQAAFDWDQRQIKRGGGGRLSDGNISKVHFIKEFHHYLSNLCPICDMHKHTYIKQSNFHDSAPHCIFDHELLC